MPIPLLGWALVGGAGYKILQTLLDEEWPGTEFPEAFRVELIENHWWWNGGSCPSCGGSGLRKCDLTVDHIVPIRRGGRNSRNNAQVLCLSCNCSKGENMSLADQFWGRGGKKPRRRD